MGLLDGNDYGGSQPMQIDPRLLMLSSMAAGVAPYMGASRLPHSTGQALAGAAGGIGPGLLQGYQAQQAGLNNAMAQQQFQMLQDALQGKGAFAENGQQSAGGGGGGSPAPGGPVGASAPSFNDMDATGVEKVLPPGLTGAVTHRDPTAFNDMDTGGLLGSAPGAGTQVAQNGAGGGTASDAPPSLLGGGGAPSAAPASGGQTIQPTAGIRRDVWGLPLPPGLTKAQAYLAAKMNPDGYKAAMAAMYADHRPGNYYRGDDMQMHQAPAAPMSGIDPSLRVGSPEYDAAVTRLKAAEAQGGVGSAIQVMSATQRAEQAKQEALARQAYRYKTGQNAPDDITSPTSAPRTAGGPLSASGPSAAPAPAMAQPGAMPSASPQNAGMKGEDFKTDRGTVVPSVKGQTLSQGEVPSGLQQAASQKTQENWNSVRPIAESARDRLSLSASLLNATNGLKGDALNEYRAKYSAMARAAGATGIADAIMGAKDVSAVQTLLWNSMQESLSSLKEINAGTGGRILNSEFTAFMEHGFSPNMMGKTLHNAVSHQLGQIYQTTNMIDDWHGPAQKMNWRDANQFQSAYLRANPIEGFVKYAGGEIGPFKGDEGNSAAPAAGVTHIWRPGKGVSPVSP